MILEKQPKTFVIALKNHPVSESQLADCLSSAKKHNWNVEIFWGVNGNTLNENSWKEIGVIPKLDKPTMNKRGTWGCFFSHWMLWNRCISLNEPIIILEHDAIIQEPWQPLEIDTHLIKLHRHYSRKRVRFDNDSGNWSKSGHAYCLLPHHAHALVTFSKKVGAFANDMMIGDKVLKYKHMTEYVTRQNMYSTTGEF